MRRAFIVSLLLHVAVIGALVVGLPHLGRDLPPDEPITVDIVSDAKEPAPSPLPPKAPLAEAAPLPQRQAAAPAPPPPPPPAPPVEKQPEPKPEPPPPPPPQLAEEKPAPPPAPAPEPKKAETPPEPKPEPPKPEPPPEPKKAETPLPEPPKPLPVTKPKPPEPPKVLGEKPVDLAKLIPKQEHPPKPPTPKQQESDLDALLASVEAQSKRVKEPEKRDAKGYASERGGTNQAGPDQQAQVNPSALIAAISRQVTPCWNIPVGAQGVEGLRAELHIQLRPDGSVQSVEPTDPGRMEADPAFRTFAESAVRAVRACAPLKLPPEQYQVWRNIIFNFDPSMLTG